MDKIRTPVDTMWNFPEIVVDGASTIHDSAPVRARGVTKIVTTQSDRGSHQGLAARNLSRTISPMFYGSSPSTESDIVRLKLRPSCPNNEPERNFSLGLRPELVSAQVKEEVQVAEDTIVVQMRTLHGEASRRNNTQSQAIVDPCDIVFRSASTQPTQSMNKPHGSRQESLALSTPSRNESTDLYPIGSLVWAGCRGVSGSTWDPWPGRVVDPKLLDNSELRSVGTSHRIVQRFAHNRPFVKMPLRAIKPYVPSPSNQKRPFRDPNGRIACILADACSVVFPFAFKGIVDERELMKALSPAQAYPEFDSNGSKLSESIDLDNVPTSGPRPKKATFNISARVWTASQSPARQVALRPVATLRRKSRKPVVVRRLLIESDESNVEGEGTVSTPICKQPGSTEVASRLGDIPNRAMTPEIMEVDVSGRDKLFACQAESILSTQEKSAEDSSRTDGLNQLGNVNCPSKGQLQGRKEMVVVNDPGASSPDRPTWFTANGGTSRLYYGLLGCEEIARDMTSFVSVGYSEEETTQLRKDLEGSCAKFKLNGPALLASEPQPSALASLLLRDRYARQGIAEDGIMYATALFISLVRSKEQMVLPEHPR